MQNKPFTKAIAVRAVAFCLILILMTIYLTRLLTPKFVFENSSWPSTSTFTQFYQMEDRTIDVLFLGSSSMSTACIPQYIYDNYGITSYNLATTEQTLITSYYWLKEALRYQHPSVVCLDNQMLFTFYADEKLNFKEPGQRKDFDRMRWSKVKVEAVNDFCRLDPEQSRLSYYFPLVRYHDRFKELTRLDFDYNISKLYGFAPLVGSLHEDGEADFVPLKDLQNAAIPDTEQSEQAEILPLMQEYMDKIIALCRENDIQLVLVTTVSPMQTQTRHDHASEYAAANNLPYLDFNTEALYNRTGMDYFTDCYDTRHMTVSGAEKISDYLAEFLLSQNMVKPRTLSCFEDTRQYYQDFYQGE
ncbi:MAG: hypothetical protein PUD03_03635 [Lachnospiraceae bacterium]|nr:hypothetical protein [Lachnospiraceae bacterium]